MQAELSLFDLENDLSERNNVLDNHPEQARKMQAQADSMRVVLGDALLNMEGEENREVGSL